MQNALQMKETIENNTKKKKGNSLYMSEGEGKRHGVWIICRIVIIKDINPVFWTTEKQWHCISSKTDRTILGENSDVFEAVSENKPRLLWPHGFGDIMEHFGQQSRGLILIYPYFRQDLSAIIIICYLLSIYNYYLFTILLELLVCYYKVHRWKTKQPRIQPCFLLRIFFKTFGSNLQNYV